MKVIQKYQQGGSYYSTYTPHQTPIQSMNWLFSANQQRQPQNAGAASAAPASSGSGSASDGKGAVGLLSKDMVKLLYEHGLPNDVDHMLATVDIFGKNVNPFTPGDTETQYRQILSILPKLKFNKESYEQAVKTAEQKGALSETAISPEGYVFIMNGNGKLTKKRVSEVSSDENPLTNSELAQLRAYDPSQAFDSDSIAATIRNGVSIKSVFDHIQKLADKIGYDKTKQESYFNKDDDTAALAEGLEAIKNGADGNYKVTNERKTQDIKARKVLKHIFETLQPNERVLLQEYARKNGMDLKTGPQQIIVDCVTGMLDDENLQSFTYTKPNKDATNSGSGSGTGTYKGKTTQVGQLEQIVFGDGLQHQQVHISTGKNMAYKVDAQVISWIPKGNGQVGPGAASEALLNSDIKRIIDTNSIHVGNQRIDATQLSKMYYDGSNAYAMDLPFTRDENGMLMPDWSLLDNFEQAQTEIRRTGAKTPQAVNAIYRKYHLGDYYKADGTPDRSKFARFMAITLIGDESVYQNADEHANTFFRINDEQVLNTITTALGADKKHPLKIDGDMYKAQAYIPIYDSPTNARTAAGHEMWAPDAGYINTVADEQQIMQNKAAGKQLNNQFSKAQI